MFTKYVDPTSSVSLSGFNNLTKVLSFNLYDFCIALGDKQREDYIRWIHEKYNAERITEISKKICDVIEANILGISAQDYDPVGASTMVLMSDIKGGGDPLSSSTQVNCHLDKSHITAHTYPDAADPNGICSFRVDFDIATCGEIIPLKAMNVLFEEFECDVVYIDYVVRGYTRLEDGKKIYNDHHFNSIRDFIDKGILEDFVHHSDINMPQSNTWQTKLMVKDFPAQRYMMEEEDASHPDVPAKMKLLQAEMKEVFHMIH